VPVSFAESGERICAKSLLGQFLPTVLALSCLQTDLNNLIGEMSIFKSGRAAQHFDSGLLTRSDSEADWGLVSMCGPRDDQRRLRSLAINVRIFRLSAQLSVLCINGTRKTIPGLSMTS
jgi:hypothetical protein